MAGAKWGDSLCVHPDAAAQLTPSSQPDGDCVLVYRSTNDTTLYSLHHTLTHTSDSHADNRFPCCCCRSRISPISILRTNINASKNEKYSFFSLLFLLFLILLFCVCAQTWAKPSADLPEKITNRQDHIIFVRISDLSRPTLILTTQFSFESERLIHSHRCLAALLF